MLKVGILTPQTYAEKVNLVASREFNYIKITDLVYKDYREVKDLIDRTQSQFDALLFAGYVPYNYAKNYCEQKIFWDVIPRHSSSIASALLIAELQGYDIKNISFDTYSVDTIKEVYQEIGISLDDVKTFGMENYIVEEDYTERVVEFHKENLKKVSCVITSLNLVYMQLITEKLPCIPIFPTNSVIREALSRLQLKLAALDNETRQLVVLFVKLNYLNEYSLIAKNEYQYALDKMKIGERVYLFAEKIQAAVVEASGSDGYLLFSTKSMLELETNNYQEIELIESLGTEVPHTISIGIGYGKTANIAKHNAVIGASKAEKCSGSAAYVIYENGHILGPIEALSKKEVVEKIDGHLLSIAEKSGVSINRINELNDIKIRDKKDCFTSKELSERLKISVRSIDRIIYKLENSGYAKVIGKRIIEKSGRPSRITKLTF